MNQHKVARDLDVSSYFVMDLISEIIIDQFDNEEEVDLFLKELLDMNILNEEELRKLPYYVRIKTRPKEDIVESEETISEQPEMLESEEPVLEEEQLVPEQESIGIGEEEGRTSSLKFIVRYAGKLCVADRLLDDGTVLKFGDEEYLVPKEEEDQIEVIAGIKDLFNMSISDLAVYEFKTKGIKQLGFKTWEEFKRQAIDDPELVQRAFALLRDIEHSLLNEIIYGKGGFPKKTSLSDGKEADSIEAKVVKIYNF